MWAGPCNGGQFAFSIGAMKLSSATLESLSVCYGPLLVQQNKSKYCQVDRGQFTFSLVVVVAVAVVVVKRKLYL